MVKKCNSNFEWNGDVSQCEWKKNGVSCPLFKEDEILL